MRSRSWWCRRQIVVLVPGTVLSTDFSTWEPTPEGLAWAREFIRRNRDTTTD